MSGYGWTLTVAISDGEKVYFAELENSFTYKKFAELVQKRWRETGSLEKVVEELKAMPGVAWVDDWLEFSMIRLNEDDESRYAVEGCLTIKQKDLQQVLARI